MTHYSGINLAVGLATGAQTAITATDISAHGRTVDVTETAPAPETIDVTHKGATVREIQEGLPGAPETNVVLKQIMEDTWTVVDVLALAAQGTIYVWPRGKTHNYPQLTIPGARLHERSATVPYDGATESTTTWNSKVIVTHTTYASA